MLPSREPLLLPFEHRLLGRVVVDPDRPTQAYFDIGIPPQELSISENDFSEIGASDFQSQHATGHVMTVTATSWTEYTLHSLSTCLEQLFCDPGFHSFQQASCRLGGNLYFISALITVSDYSIAPKRASRYAKEKQATKLGGITGAEGARVTTGTASKAGGRPDLLVVAMTFRKLQQNRFPWRRTSGLTLKSGLLNTSFLDWEHSREEKPVLGSLIWASYARGLRRFSLDLLDPKHWGRKRSEPITIYPTSGPFSAGALESHRDSLELIQNSIEIPTFPPFPVEGFSGLDRIDHVSTYRSVGVGEGDQDSFSIRTVTSSEKGPENTTEALPCRVEREPSADPVSPPSAYCTSIVESSKTSEAEHTTQQIVPAVVIDHSWAIQFSRGKKNITFPFQCRPTLANTTKGWIEQVV